jgi:hypothetical protein
VRERWVRGCGICCRKGTMHARAHGPVRASCTESKASACSGYALNAHHEMCLMGVQASVPKHAHAHACVVHLHVHVDVRARHTCMQT